MKRAEAAEERVRELEERSCLHCELAFVDCPRQIELIDGGGPMDIDYCSEWTARLTAPKEEM